MITHPAYTLEPWAIRETSLDLDVLAQSESCFALANGHIGLRGNLDEGEPHGLPGTYLNAFYEVRPLPYAEAGYGFPEAGQTVVNVTNGKVIRLLVDDEPFDIRYGQLLSHERVLDLRAGVLRRVADWVSPAGGRVRLDVTTAPDGTIAVAVTDTGIGIAADDLDRIFEPFRRANPSISRAHEGSGLGLAITKRLIELNGGRLSLESQVGLGTTVTVWLPAAQSSSLASLKEIASSG